MINIHNTQNKQSLVMSVCHFVHRVGEGSHVLPMMHWTSPYRYPRPALLDMGPHCTGTPSHSPQPQLHCRRASSSAQPLDREPHCRSTPFQTPAPAPRHVQTCSTWTSLSYLDSESIQNVK